jgi:hypothetical protein
MAVDALRLDWSEVVPPVQVAWVFPPFQCINTLITLLERYRVEALLCLSIKPGSNELIQLGQLRQAKVSEPLKVPKKSSSCIPSERFSNLAVTCFLRTRNCAHPMDMRRET